MKTLPCGNISYFWTWFHPVLYLLHAVQLGKSLCFRKSVIFCRLLPTTSPSFSLSCCTTKCAFELKSICHSNKEEQRCWVTEFGHSAAVYRDTYLLVVLFCVSRSSTWGSLPLGISEAEFHPFLTASCITTPTDIADYADAHHTFFRGNPWQNWPSNLSKWRARGRSGPHVERIWANPSQPFLRKV